MKTKSVLTLLVGSLVVSFAAQGDYFRQFSVGDFGLVPHAQKEKEPLKESIEKAIPALKTPEPQKVLPTPKEEKELDKKDENPLKKFKHIEDPEVIY